MFANPFHKYSSLITTPNLPLDIEGRADSLWEHFFFVEKKHINTHFIFELLRAAYEHSSTTHFVTKATGKEPFVLEINFHLCCNEHLSAFVDLQLQLH